MSKTLSLVASLMLFAMLAGCAATEEDSPTAEADEGVSVTFSLGSAFGALEASELGKIKYFRMRVYSDEPLDAEEEALFDSLKIHGCFKAGGTEIKIRDLKAGSDRFVFYEGFSDGSCEKRVAIGIRGGIKIAKKSDLQLAAAAQDCDEDDVCKAEIHPDARCDCAKDEDSNGDDLPYCQAGSTGSCTVTPPVFVPLYLAGQFNRLPTPSDGLKAKAANQACDSDLDCEGVHKAAVCDEELGFCAVQGLFPFAPSRQRAFHTASVLESGKVLFSGGFNRLRDGEHFVAEGPFFEVFDPFTGLFKRPTIEDEFSGQEVAMHRATVLQGHKVIITGGVSEAVFKYEQGGEIKLKLEVPFETNYNCDASACFTFSKSVVVADEGAGTVVESFLPKRLVVHQAAVVQKEDDPTVVISGGITFNDETFAPSTSDRYIECGVDDILAGQGAVCAEDDTTSLHAPRYSHASACLVEEGDLGPCDEYLIFGGVNEGQPPAEVFSSTRDDGFNKPLSFTEVTKLNEVLFPFLAKVEDEPGKPAKLYSFGGVSADSVSIQNTDSVLTTLFSAPDVMPQQVNVNLGTQNMTTAGFDLKDLEPAGAVYRLFHTVSVLEEGRIMLVGGLGEDNTPTKKVLFFEEPETHALTYYGPAKMAKTARFGHTATVLKHGLLKGAVLIVGGMKVDKGTGSVLFADDAEIYIP